MTHQRGGKASRARVPAVRYDITLLSNDDLYLFNEGSHYQLYRKLGAHPMSADGEEGTTLRCGFLMLRRYSSSGTSTVGIRQATPGCYLPQGREPK